MQRRPMVSFGFLTIAAITLAVPILMGLWVGTQAADDPLHDTYYVVLPAALWLSLVLAPALFGIAYLAGEQFAALEYRSLLRWFHFALWVAGAGLILAPLVLIRAITSSAESYAVGLSVDSDAFDQVMVIGYCVTLLSALVFAICFGEAVIKRLGRGKEL